MLLYTPELPIKGRYLVGSRDTWGSNTHLHFHCPIKANYPLPSPLSGRRFLADPYPVNRDAFGSEQMYLPLTCVCGREGEGGRQAERAACVPVTCAAPVCQSHLRRVPPYRPLYPRRDPSPAAPGSPQPIHGGQG